MSDFVADLTKSIPHIQEDLVLDAAVRQITIHSAETVDVPTISDPDIAIEAHALTGVKVGDFVLVAPTEALPTAARLQGAFVTATDIVTFVFGSEGGSVTGATKTFDVLVFHRS